MADITPARKLFDLLVSRDFDPELLDSSGKPATDPAEAEIFSFDFRAESGKDYGTVVIMLSDDGELQVYCADNVGKTMEEPDKTDWFNFLEQLKNFAVRTNRLNFSVKNLNHLRYSMQGQAAIKEGLFESWTGRKDISYNAGPNQARLMIKHKRSLGEDEARFRYVESLFIETAESERYKLPFKNLTAGKAMLEHVRQGGKPYDIRGQHIAEMVSELNVLARFRRANQGRLLEGDTEQLVEQTNAYYENLQHNLKSLTGHRGYDAYFESWNPTEVSEESMVIEGLKHLFVTQSIDQRIEDALPLIAKIQQQGTAMKEANIFEAWADRLVEGIWSTPDTPKKQAELVALLSKELIVGADATDATEQLYDLIGDDELFDQLEELARRDANADARDLVYDRLQELADRDPGINAVLQAIGADTGADEDDGIVGISKDDYFKKHPNSPAAENPYRNKGITEDPVQEGDLEDCDSIGGDAADAFIRGVEVPEKEYQMEDALRSIRRAAGLVENVLKDDTGSTFDHILATFKRDVKDFEAGDELSDDLYHALYDYYFDDMPYGTQKARTGDPHEWVADRFGADLGISGYGSNSPGVPDEDYGIERESVMSGDYAEEAGDSLGGILRSAGVPAKERPAPDYVTGDLEPTAEAASGAMGMGASMPAPTSGGAGPTTSGGAGPTKEGVLGTLGGAGLGMMLGGPLGAAVGAVGGQELTKGGSGIIEQGEEETDEGTIGATLGGIAGALATKSPSGAMMGAKIGDKIGDALSGDDTTNEVIDPTNPRDYEIPAIQRKQAGQAPLTRQDIEQKDRKAEFDYHQRAHGEPHPDSMPKENKSPLAGQYGHSGKMKEVGKDVSFLDRLKELAGMRK